MNAAVVIPAPARLLTVNAHRRMHHMEAARIIKEWRTAAKVWAKVCKVPTFESVDVVCQVEQAKGVLADPQAHVLVLKACIDGLVDARVLVDDSGEYVKSITNLPVKKGEKDQVTLGLSGDPREDKVTAADVLADRRAMRARAIATAQRNCPHPKKLAKVCVKCGATC